MTESTQQDNTTPSPECSECGSGGLQGFCNVCGKEVCDSCWSLHQRGHSRQKRMAPDWDL